MKQGHPRSVWKTDLDTLATALYVKTDDLLKESPQLAPWRPAGGICPKLTDAELVTLAVMQALRGFTSEARWLGLCPRSSAAPVPVPAQQPGYDEWVRDGDTDPALIGDVYHQHQRLDRRCLVVGSTRWNAAGPARQPNTTTWPDRARCGAAPRTPAGSGACSCTLIATLGGLPVAFALTGPSR